LGVCGREGRQQNAAANRTVTVQAVERPRDLGDILGLRRKEWPGLYLNQHSEVKLHFLQSYLQR
jgi:hypothetical protein